jgi:hypothetical protein
MFKPWLTVRRTPAQSAAQVLRVFVQDADAHRFSANGV